ncbi:hypothetical protein BDZ89DRAFT_1232343 [Hymenopellis radicata]|nr:hypothetical protein BDZ89DRAFT_1232343 [Hymenopellis radicata]
MATSLNPSLFAGDYPLLDSSRLDNTSSSSQRVTMKTRVAIRDNTPHRFEVVQLSEAEQRAKLSSTHQGISPLSRNRVKPSSLESFSCNSASPSDTKRLDAVSSISSHSQDDNRLVFKQTPSLKITPKRRNYSVQSATPLDSLPSTPSRCSKSTSLSGLSAGNTPQSAEHPRRGMTPSPNSHWRQAIYAQSLSVPTLDFLSEPPSISSASPSPANKRQSSMPRPFTASQAYEDSGSLAYDGCELVVPFPSPTCSFSSPTCPLRNVPYRSRSASLARNLHDSSSLEEDATQDAHNRIISELLVAVDGVLQEWTFSSDSV